MAVFVLVAAALCQHPPVPPTAERTNMGQDLGQIKALTVKRERRYFQRAAELVSDLQHGCTSHSCSTSRRVSWSLAGFLKYYLCSHSVSFSASVHCSCVKRVILGAVCKAELQPCLEVQAQQGSAQRVTARMDQLLCPETPQSAWAG